MTAIAPLWVTVDDAADAPHAILGRLSSILQAEDSQAVEKFLRIFAQHGLVRIRTQIGQKELDRAWNDFSIRYKHLNQRALTLIRHVAVFDSSPSGQNDLKSVSIDRLVEGIAGTPVSATDYASFWMSALRISTSVRIIDRHFLSKPEKLGTHPYDTVLDGFQLLGRNHSGSVEIICGGTNVKDGQTIVHKKPNPESTRNRIGELLPQLKGVHNHSVKVHILTNNSHYSIHDRFVEFTIDMATGASSEARRRAFACGQGIAGLLENRKVTIHAVQSSVFEELWTDAIRQVEPEWHILDL